MGNRRQIGLTGAIALVVGNMIGTGVFTTTGFLIADLPSRPAILAAWFVGGCIALAGAACYGAIAKHLPESGGEYFFLSRTIHPAAGYIGGWVSLLVGFSAPIAAAAFAVGEYVKPWLPDGLNPKWVGTTTLLSFAVIHAIRVRPAVQFQNAIVGLKLVLLFGFVGVGAAQIEMAPKPLEGKPTFGAFMVSLVWIYFAYSGWNAAVYVAGEVKDPHRNLPRALLWGTSLVVLFYLALNAVMLYATAGADLAGKVDVARLAAIAIGGPILGAFTTGLILIALLTSISAMVMAGPRVYAKMAEDGILPACFDSETPPARNAVVLQLVVALLMLWIPRFPDLVKYIGFTLGIGTALTVVGLIRLKRKENIAVPGWPWLPALFLGAISAVSVFSIAREPAASLFGLASLGVGWLAWKLQGVTPRGTNSTSPSKDTSPPQ